MAGRGCGMSREWKPGDVAEIRWPMTTGAEKESGIFVNDQGHGVTLRRLAIIDPEDAEQVSRLAHLIWPPGGPLTQNRLSDALREFANPTPPKPDEPTGLGAVVEDAEGNRWVRDEAASVETTPRSWYRRGEGGCREWRHITAVRVLSPGVEDAR